MKAFVVSRSGRTRNCRVHRSVTMYTRPGRFDETPTSLLFGQTVAPVRRNHAGCGPLGLARAGLRLQSAQLPVPARRTCENGRVMRKYMVVRDRRLHGGVPARHGLVIQNMDASTPMRILFNHVAHAS